MDIAFANQMPQMLAAARMDHHRTCGDDCLAPLVADPAQIPGDLFHHQLHPPLARDAGPHKAKLFCGRFFKGGGGTPSANAFAADNDGFSWLQIPQQLTASHWPVWSIGDGNGPIHPLPLHPNPLSTDGNLRRIDGCYIEIIRCHP